MRTYPTDLYLCTTIQRAANDGETVECDAIVYYEARMTSPGCKARTYGDPANCWPAEAPEFDITFDRVDFDGKPIDAPGPMTEIEAATLRKWFDDNEKAAIEFANDNYCGERP